MLTETQKAQIRLYLGFPDKFRYLSTRLESILDDVSPEAEVQVATILTSLDAVEQSLLDTGTDGAGVKRVDEIWLENGSTRSAEIRKYGRQLVGRLSIIVGVPINSDYFGGGGYTGDSFTSGFGVPNRGGGFFGLG